MTSPLVLDTCAWLWISTGHARFTRAARDVLEGRKWLLPTICVWELATLVKKGRLTLDRPIREWVGENLNKSGNLDLAMLRPEIAILSTELHHCRSNDPADRIILATAIVETGQLVTSDQKLLEYCREKNLPIFEM